MTYNPQRTRNLFRTEDEKPFKLSRSKIQDFLDCPRCFYLDRKCGTGKPDGAPFRLNSAVDSLLKKEFDKFRAEGKAHPLMEQHSIDAVPFAHANLDEWRSNFKGVQYHHGASNFIITGAVDDLWVTPTGELIVVDYKATATSKEVQLDDSEYKTKLKRQIEVYQWLLRQKGFQVMKTGYFIYCNGDDSKDAFNSTLEFSISVLPYEGDDSWIEPILLQIRACLEQEQCPQPNNVCPFCRYRQAALKHVQDFPSGLSDA